MEDKTKPTQKQLDYATYLINELGYDMDWYALEAMSRTQLGKLIDELRKELEG